MTAAEVEHYAQACRLALREAARSAVHSVPLVAGYAVVPSTCDGLPALWLVTAAGEAVPLTVPIIATMHRGGPAWAFGRESAQLLAPEIGTPQGPLAEVRVAVLVRPHERGRQWMVKLYGTLRASEGASLVLLREQPWAGLPPAVPSKVSHDERP